MSEQIEEVWFTGSAGDRLSGRLDRPRAEPVAYALFVHCFPGSKIPAATRISRGLVDRGIGVLQFDFTGLGTSEGEFADTNFSSIVEDVVRAADELRHRDAAPKILVGHSLGGAAVLAAAAQVPEAVAVVTIGAPFDLARLARTPSDAVPALNRTEEVSVEIDGRSPIRCQLLDDPNAPNLTNAIRTLGRALLVFHAPEDEVVAIDDAQRIFYTAKQPKSFVALDDADHFLTGATDAAYVAEVLAAWIGRYLDTSSQRELVVGREGVVVVTDAPRGRLAQEIRAGRHVLIADEPADVGDDLGPTPYDLLLASLGACTAMTLRLYAERKGWSLEHLSVQLTHERTYADDSRNCEKTPCRIERIGRVVNLAGPLSDGQRQRLLAIAERCPVHRTLIGEKRIATRLGSVGCTVRVGNGERSGERP
jgi:uncharacterized OsmC-like protein/alpha-beta hydrolase superfamily lysophospholipase